MFLAKVTELIDDNSHSKLKFVIKFTAKGIVENAVAYPVNVFDQPEVGDEVMIYELETIFGFSYMYQKLKLTDDTRLKVEGSIIDIDKDLITIKSDKGDLRVKLDKGDISVSVNGNINLSVKGSIKINSNSCFVPPNTTGPFNAIPTCPYTGQPHVGNEIILT